MPRIRPIEADAGAGPSPLLRRRAGRDKALACGEDEPT